MNLQNEIELFLESASELSFIPPDPDDKHGEALLFIIFHKDKLHFFSNSESHNKVMTYFANRAYKLVIFIKDTTPKRISFVNHNTGDIINVSKPIFNKNIEDFVNYTEETEKIILLLTYREFANETIFSPEIYQTPPIEIDGYSLVYV